MVHESGSIQSNRQKGTPRSCTKWKNFIGRSEQEQESWKRLGLSWWLNGEESGEESLLMQGGVRAHLLQPHPTLCDPVDCSPPDSSVHGILQAKILEWVAMPWCRGYRFNPWSGKIPHAVEQLSLWSKEKPLQWEAQALQRSAAPTFCN